MKDYGIARGTLEMLIKFRDEVRDKWKLSLELADEEEKKDSEFKDYFSGMADGESLIVDHLSYLITEFVGHLATVTYKEGGKDNAELVRGNAENEGQPD